MRILELARSLKSIHDRCGDVDVMFEDPQGHGGPFDICDLSVQIAGKNEYPKDFNMPKGFTFALIKN